MTTEPQSFKRQLARTDCADSAAAAAHVRRRVFIIMSAVRFPIKPTQQQIEMFWSRVNKSGTGECWLWTGLMCGDYGVFTLNGHDVRAHRASYTIVSGQIPDGMQVCHKCDNPRCVNPAHLFLGTQADNMRDMWAKGRGVSSEELRLRAMRTAPRGESHKDAKLTAKDVREIRQIYKERSASQVEMALRYGVSEAAIWSVLRGVTWRHVT